MPPSPAPPSTATPATTRAASGSSAAARPVTARGPRHPLAGRTAWVIGASSGIGAALATELDRRGCQVVVSARREERLRELAGDRMTVVAADVTDAGQLDEAAAQVYASVGDPDLVVFNAGFWEQTDATAWDRGLVARHVEVNLLGLNNAIGAVLPTMLDARRGTFVGVASVAGYRGIAGAEAYGATKAAQINLLEGLRAAVSGHGVGVVTVCPGFVRTEMTARNDFPMPFLIEADQAARSICDGLERGRLEIVFPLRMAALMKTVRLLPVRTWAAIGRRMAGA